MREPRRVVTGHDELGRSVVVSDSGPGFTLVNEPRASRAHELWATEANPPVVGRVMADPAGRALGFPGPGGTIFRFADIDPDPFSPGAGEEAPSDAEVARAVATFPDGLSQWKPGVHPGMHRTESIDYAVVLDGEIDMLLDVGEIHLTTGDVVVQCGTSHAWVNRSGRVTRMLFVLVGAEFEPDLAADFDRLKG
jgi:hypothetical protein